MVRDSKAGLSPGRDDVGAKQGTGANLAPQALQGPAAKSAGETTLMPRIRAPVENGSGGKFDMQHRRDEPDMAITSNSNTAASWSLVKAMTGHSPGPPRPVRVRIVR